MSERTAVSRGSALSWLVLAYLLALAVAFAVGYLLRGHHTLLVALGADVAATLVIFAFSVRFDNSSFYDPYWSVAPLPVAIYFALSSASGAATLRQGLLLGLLALWGARLTWNWWRGWSGLDHEDWRYVELRRKHGRGYWLVSLTGIHLMPTLLVFGGLLPAWAALAGPGRALGWLDAVGALVALTAIAIEALADQQLRAFRQRSDRQPEEILESGLWATSRHPNYFGELLFWWGLLLLGLAAAPGAWWTGVGALGMTGLFLFISIPMIDARMLARRPAYGERMRRVSALIPRFPRR